MGTIVLTDTPGGSFGQDIGMAFVGTETWKSSLAVAETVVQRMSRR